MNRDDGKDWLEARRWREVDDGQWELHGVRMVYVDGSENPWYAHWAKFIRGSGPSPAVAIVTLARDVEFVRDTVDVAAEAMKRIQR